VPRRPKTLIGVTGSTGYLGSSLVGALRGQSVDVVEYRRTVPDGDATGSIRQLDLSQPVDSTVFKGVTCLVHAAWDLVETDPRRAWELNVLGSKRVIESALNAGVRRVIFVSSMSAYFGTKQDYGLMKLAVERTVLEADQIVVRPGLVYGAQSGGMAQTLTKLARLPIIPVFRGAQQFTLHIDDFLSAMSTLVTAKVVPSAVIGLANESPTSFKQIMLSLTPAANSSAKTVVVPWPALLALLRVGERLHVPLPVRSDSLLGLVRPAPSVPGRDVAAKIGLSFRPYEASQS
jgi:nucleoside-diphosphate-sugar epimerase